MENEFAIHFFRSLLRDAYSVQTHNYDWLRYGAGFQARLRERVKDWIAIVCEKCRVGPWRCDEARLVFILENLTAFNDCYHLLNDAYSREMMVKVLAFRILGPRHVKLPSNTEEFWRKYTSVDAQYARAMRTQSYWNGKWSFNRYEVPAGQGTVTLDAHPVTVINTFLLEQYAYRQGGKNIAVKAGDVVIDGGACYGDSGLYFAAKAGSGGGVVCFEFIEENIKMLKRNLSANAALASTIRLVNKAMWSRSGEKLCFQSDGPGSRISSQQKDSQLQVETASLDDVVTGEKLRRVDFIKMDIEGAELEALKGARRTIEQFKPTLAISLYHKKEDFITIPQWIQSLGLGYEFYLDHFTIHDEETVLFATSRG